MNQNLPCHAFIQNRCFLDLTLSSELLSTKIADIPQKFKFKIIIQPIFEYCFGTIDDDFIWEQDCNNFDDFDNRVDRMDFKIDWIRDRTFINGQLFKLPIDKLDILARKFGLLQRRSFVMDCLPYHNILQFLDDEFKKDREIVMTAVREFGVALKFAPTEFRNDFEIVKTALEQNGMALEYASYELKNNKEIVMQAVRNHGYALQYVSEELINDKEVVVTALESCSTAYEFASEELKNDREIIVSLFSKCFGKNNQIYQANLKFRSDRELVLILTKLHGFDAMEFAAEELRNDREIVLQATENYPNAMIYASDELKNDREFVKQILMKNGSCLKYVPTEYQDDKELVELALKSCPDVIHFISERFRKDIGFITKLVGRRGFKSEIPQEFISDREILLQSIKLYAGNFNSVPEALKSDREFILQAVSIHGSTLQFVKEECKDREIVLAAVSQDGAAISHAKEFLDDEEIILKAAETALVDFKSVSNRLRTDRQFILKLCKKNGRHFEYLPRKYQLD